MAERERRKRRSVQLELPLLAHRALDLPPPFSLSRWRATFLGRDGVPLVLRTQVKLSAHPGAMSAFRSHALGGGKVLSAESSMVAFFWVSLALCACSPRAARFGCPSQPPPSPPSPPSPFSLACRAYTPPRTTPSSSTHQRQSHPLSAASSELSVPSLELALSLVIQPTNRARPAGSFPQHIPSLALLPSSSASPSTSAPSRSCIPRLLARAGIGRTLWHPRREEVRR